MALFTQLGHFSSDADEGQVQDRVQRPPAAGAGEGVPLQPLHHHQEEGRARKHDRTFRETGKQVECNGGDAIKTCRYSHKNIFVLLRIDILFLTG